VLTTTPERSEAAQCHCSLRTAGRPRHLQHGTVLTDDDDATSPAVWNVTGSERARPSDGRRPIQTSQIGRVIAVIGTPGRHTASLAGVVSAQFTVQ
jgi:hypothetical protein